MQPERRPFGLQDIVVIFATLSLTWIQMRGFAIDPGVGWHLATGERILKHEIFPRIDPFLSTSTPRAWVADQWLADVFLFTVYAIGSWPLLYGALTATFLATYYLILYPLTVKTIGSPILAIGATLLAFKLGQIHFILRPVIFGFLCFAILSALVWRREIARRTTPPLSPRKVPLDALIAPLFIVWANVHPSFALGLVFLALRPIAVLVDRAIGVAPTLERHEFRNATRTVIGATLATCVNPNGLELHRSIMALGTDRFFMNLHEEWLPPVLTHGIGLALLITALLIATSFLFERKARSFRSFEVFVFLTFGWFACGAIRIVPFFAIATMVPLARTLANHELIRPTARRPWQLLRAAWLTVSTREMKSTRGLVTTCVLCLLLVLDPLIRGAVLLYDGPFGPPTERFPYGAVQVLADTATPTTPVIVVAPPEWGGFITGFGGEFTHPIIDDRNTLLGADFYRSFEAALQPGGPWESYLGVHNASFLLLPSSSPLNAEVERSPELEVIFRDTVGILYKRAPSRPLGSNSPVTAHDPNQTNISPPGPSANPDPAHTPTP